MDGETFVLLSGALTFGAPLVFAVWELLTLRRGDGGSWKNDPRPDAPPPPAPAGNKPLPDCLIPKLPPLTPTRTRVLEDA